MEAAAYEAYLASPLFGPCHSGNVHDTLLCLELGLGEPDTAFHLAAHFGHARLLNALVDNGHRPLISPHTALGLGVGRNKEVMQALLRATPDVDARDSLGYTTLHFAAQLGCLQDAILLVKAGADVNARATNGETPLMLAVIAKGMLQRMANAQNVRLKGCESSPGGRLLVLDFLLRKGADHGLRREEDNATALGIAAAMGDIASVQKLEEAGAQK